MSKRIWIFLLPAIIFLNGCGGENEQLIDPIAGNWQARWELINPEMFPVFEQNQRVMFGEVFFDLKQARIRAFGFEGCAFKSDTSENVLFFRKENGRLNLIDTDDDVIFSFTIASEKEDLLELLLMEDITLTLSR